MGDGRGDVFVDAVVEDEGEGDLVEVKRQRLEVEEIGDGLDVGQQGVGAREGEGVVHGDGWMGGESEAGGGGGAEECKGASAGG